MTSTVAAIYTTLLVVFVTALLWTIWKLWK